MPPTSCNQTITFLYDGTLWSIGETIFAQPNVDNTWKYIGNGVIGCDENNQQKIQLLDKEQSCGLLDEGQTCVIAVNIIIIINY